MVHPHLPPDEPPPRPPLSAPRYSVRALLLTTALAGLTLACFRWFGALPTAILLFAAASVVAHVAGNALGARLRTGAARQRPSASRRPLGAETAAGAPRPPAQAPPTRLSEKTPLIAPLSVAAALGAAAGGGAGVVFFTAHQQEKATLADTVLGAFAFGLLGAMALAVCTGFVLVMWSAWKAATKTD